MYEQLDMFYFLPKENLVFKPGDWVDKEFAREKLTFDKITQMIGNLIVMDKSTSSNEWFEVVRVEKIVIVEGNQRRLVYYDRTRRNGLVNEVYFGENFQYPARAYRLKQ